MEEKENYQIKKTENKEDKKYSKFSITAEEFFNSIYQNPYSQIYKN